MSALEAERLNAKYSEFYLTRWSPRTYRFKQVGKPRRTIQEATKAAMMMDAKDGHWMTFIDVVKPR